MRAKPSWRSASCTRRVAASPPITRATRSWRWRPKSAPRSAWAIRAHPHLTLTPEEVARSQKVNQSVYLVRAPALFYALDRLRPDNAQREEYLSDIVSILAQVHDHGRQHYRVAALTVTDPSLVIGFNNPAELLEIENMLRAKEAAARPVRRPRLRAAERFVSGRRYLGSGARPCRAWLPYAERLSVRNHRYLRQQLTYIYGDNPHLLSERLGAYAELLQCARRH